MGLRAQGFLPYTLDINLSTSPTFQTFKEASGYAITRGFWPLHTQDGTCVYGNGSTKLYLARHREDDTLRWLLERPIPMSDIQNLIVAINGLAAAITGNGVGKPAAAKPAADKKPESKPAGPTVEELKEACKKLVSVADRDAVTGVLKSFGADKLADLKQDQYQAVADALAAAIAEADL